MKIQVHYGNEGNYIICTKVKFFEDFAICYSMDDEEVGRVPLNELNFIQHAP